MFSFFTISTHEEIQSQFVSCMENKLLLDFHKDI